MNLPKFVISSFRTVFSIDTERHRLFNQTKLIHNWTFNLQSVHILVPTTYWFTWQQSLITKHSHLSDVKQFSILIAFSTFLGPRSLSTAFRWLQITTSSVWPKTGSGNFQPSRSNGRLSGCWWGCAFRVAMNKENRPWQRAALPCPWRATWALLIPLLSYATDGDWLSCHSSRLKSLLKIVSSGASSGTSKFSCP